MATKEIAIVVGDTKGDAVNALDVLEKQLRVIGAGKQADLARAIALCVCENWPDVLAELDRP